MKYNIEQSSHYMKEALKEACKAYKFSEIPIGCVIVKNGDIIGRGFNYCEHSHRSTSHAEIRAIESASIFLNNWRLDGTSLFVTLEPCLMCTGAILNSRIDEVYYGIADYKAGMAGSLNNFLSDSRLKHHAEVKKGILEKDCLKLLKSFFINIRKSKK